jgi:hypothetical protein
MLNCLLANVVAQTCDNCGVGHTVNTADYNVVGGGYFNNVDGVYSTIGGGTYSVVDANYATIAGGQANTATGDYAAVGGGAANKATGSLSTVGGGQLCITEAGFSTVGGGKQNKASGYASTVGGGYANTASGMLSAIPGGTANIVSADNSLALGSNGEAGDPYAAVLSFDSSGATCTSQGEGTVNICADNGLHVDSSLFVNGEDLMERISAMEDLIASLTGIHL